MAASHLSSSGKASCTVSATYSPDESEIPRSRVAPWSKLAFETLCKIAPCLAASSAVPSVEPESTTTTSRSKSPSCASSLRSSSSKPGPALKVGMTTETFSANIRRFSRVILFEQGGRYPLDLLYLPWSEILLPASWGCLAVKLASALLLLRDVLPGVLLHSPCQLMFVYRYTERRVDASHGAQSVCPEVLVADHDFRTSVGVVGHLGVTRVLHVDVRPAPGERVGVFIRQRIALPSALVLALVEPVSLSGSIKRR